MNENEPMIFQVKVPYTVSADITKCQGAPFNVHPDQFYVDQTKKRNRNSKYQFNDRRHLDVQKSASYQADHQPISLFVFS